MEAPLIMRILALSTSCGRLASRVIRDTLSKGNLEIVDKGINDLQTLADRNAQRLIVHSLSMNFPALKVIGEEGDLNREDVEICKEFDESVLKEKCPAEYLNVTTEDTVVWVDPVDGTKEFTQGLVHHVTVLIGISVKGKSVGGVICQPFYRETDLKTKTLIHIETEKRQEEIESTSIRTIWGLEGLGVFGLNKKNTPLNNPIFDRDNVIVTTRSHPTELSTSTIESCGPSEVHRVGGCGFKVLALLDNLAHAYVFASSGCKKWDTCAPEGILRAANGELTDIQGNRYKYDTTVEHLNSRGVLATAKKEWHSQYVEKIPKAVKDSLI